MKHGVLAAAAALVALPALAQDGTRDMAPGRPPAAGGAVIQRQPNTTGNDQDVVIAPGATGADTVTTNSAAGGNANLPERPVPNGSAGGSSGGR